MKGGIKKFFFLWLVAAALFMTCGKEKTPSRDHIPLIKAALSKLQEAVRVQDTAAIDSLLSVEILKRHQSSDSLLNFVYGAGRQFSFESFGEPVIIYTEAVAKIECYVMDSTHQTKRPVILNFVYSSDQWLLSGFAVNTNPGDPL